MDKSANVRTPRSKITLGEHTIQLFHKQWQYTLLMPIENSISASFWDTFRQFESDKVGLKVTQSESTWLKVTQNDSKWCNVYVSPHKGTGPVLELGPIFCPVLELGHGRPQPGTVPPWGTQCWNWAPRSGTANLTLNQSATLNCTMPIWGHQHGTKNRSQFQHWASANMGGQHIRMLLWVILSHWVLTQKLQNDPKLCKMTQNDSWDIGINLYVSPI